MTQDNEPRHLQPSLGKMLFAAIELMQVRQGAMIRSVMLVFFTVIAPLSAAAESEYLPVNIQQALYDELYDANVGVDIIEPTFVRYARDGSVKAFQCDLAAAYKLYVFHSGGGSSVSVGECSKDSALNEDYADTQTKAFDVALRASADWLRKSVKERPRPTVVTENDATTIYLQQLLLSGIGGVGGHGAGTVESVLIIPNSGQRLVFAQGVPPGNCGGRKVPEVCGNFRGVLRRLAEMVVSMRSLIDVAP